MRFESLADFLAMGGHGPFVWSAYAIALVVLLLNVVLPVLQTRRTKAMLKAQLSAAKEGVVS